jgi:hypothetical protein
MCGPDVMEPEERAISLLSSGSGRSGAATGGSIVPPRINSPHHPADGRHPQHPAETGQERT